MKITHEDRELFYANKFLQSLNVPNLGLKKGDDPPDLVLELQGSAVSNIGIEMTEFHSNVTSPSGKPRRAIEEGWNDILKVIRQQRKEHPILNCVSCTLFFKRLDVPGKKDHFQFVSELIRFLISKDGNLTSEFYEFREDFNSELLTKYLDKVVAQKTACNYIGWNWNHSASGVGLSEDELKMTIMSKVLTVFNDGFDEIWLIIVSGDGMSQAMGLPEVETLHEFNEVNTMLDKSHFDRVFIFEYMFDRILERKINSKWTQRKCHPNL